MAQRPRRRPAIRRDVDGAWKQVLRDLLPECIAFAHPDLHRAINWSRTPEFMDKELQAVARRAATGRRNVDLLAKVWLHDGEERWLFIHVEVQAQREADFAERMYLYHTLLFLQHRRPIVSLAILIDPQADWKPTNYTYDHWGCAIEFRYPVLKILDWRGREAQLAQSTNPFAQVALAQLAILTSHGQLASLAEMRRAIVRQLYRAGYSQTYVLALLTFMDWTMAMPEETIAAIDAEVAREEGVTVQRLKSRWEERTELQGQRQLVLLLLERRCGVLDDATRERISDLPGNRLVVLAEALLDFTDRSDLDRWLSEHAA